MNNQQPQQSLQGIYGNPQLQSQQGSQFNQQAFGPPPNQFQQQPQQYFQGPQQLSNAQVAQSQAQFQQNMSKPSFQQQQQQYNFSQQQIAQNVNVNMYPSVIPPNAYPNMQMPTFNYINQYSVNFQGMSQTQVGNGLDKIPLDDPIQEEKNVNQMPAENAKINLEQDLIVSVKANQKCIRLSKDQNNKIPILVSLKTKDNQLEGQRAPVDLICVIDHSGSMADFGKMQLAQKTLVTLLSLLNDKDRLQIIEFDNSSTILTRLMFVNNQNKPEFEKVINSIRAAGGTNITDGMDLAFQSIAGRKYRNPVTSIFLLSDGLDGGAVQGVTNQLKSRNLQDSFTINSFGFGQDHDPILMSGISKLKDGNFYFIQELNTLVEYFADALGGLVSVVARDISIAVTSKCQPPLQETKVVYAYGDNWVQNDGRFTKQLQYLIAGTSKDFIFEVEIPKLQENIEDYQRNQEVVIAYIQATDVSTGLVINIKESITLTFYNDYENIPPQEEDEDLMLNYFRVKGAQFIDDARIACQKGKFQDGEQILDGFIQQIQQKPYAQKAQNLVLELQNQKTVCKPAAFQQYGQIQMIQANYQQMQQCSQPQYAQMGAGLSNQNRMQVAFQAQAKSQF